MRYALSLADPERVFILSAKHGLLSLDDVIEPYDLKMGQDGCVTPGLVLQQAVKRGLIERDVVALGGKGYVDICRRVWPGLLAPLDGVGGMGKQIGWMKRNMGRMPK